MNLCEWCLKPSADDERNFKLQPEQGRELVFHRRCLIDAARTGLKWRRTVQQARVEVERS